MRLSIQTIALMVVGLADLVSTLWFWKVHAATEANPLMALFLAQGVVAFVLAKVGSLAAPLVVIEWARRRRPVFVARASTVAVLAYLGLYAWGVSHLNAEPADQPQVSEAARQAVWQRLRTELVSDAGRRARAGERAPRQSTSYALAALREAGVADGDPHDPM